MYYNIKKGADAVGAPSGHWVRACALELYQDHRRHNVAVTRTLRSKKSEIRGEPPQDHVSRPVWCERGGNAGVYGATADTMLR